MLWWAALGAVVIGFTLAVLAAATKRDWLAIPVIVPLLGVLTLRVMNVAEPDERSAREATRLRSARQPKRCSVAARRSATWNALR